MNSIFAFHSPSDFVTLYASDHISLSESTDLTPLVI